jgi:hypothetical protein
VPSDWFTSQIPKLISGKPNGKEKISSQTYRDTLYRGMLAEIENECAEEVDRKPEKVDVAQAYIEATDAFLQICRSGHRPTASEWGEWLEAQTAYRRVGHPTGYTAD